MPRKLPDKCRQTAGYYSECFVSTGERVKLNKKLPTFQIQDTEIRTYEEKIHYIVDQMISIDLEDGVKENYAIFQDVMTKIK